MTYDNYYVIWFQLNDATMLFDSWLDSTDALLECASLNKRDESGFYYVTYKGDRL
tara:strand:+ start:498 stop:662 length:165 start_codon:yes stop_codon:yes gene_type:complete